MREFIIPISYTASISMKEDNCMTFFNVIFMEDFGIFKKDFQCPNLNVYLIDGIAEFADRKDGVFTQRFKAIPIN